MRYTFLAFIALLYAGLRVNAQDTTKTENGFTINYAKSDTVKHIRHYVHHLPIIHHYSGYIAVTGGEAIPRSAYSATGSSGGGVIGTSMLVPGIHHIGLTFKFDYGWNGVNQLQFLNDVAQGVNVPNLQYSIVGNPGNFTFKTLLAGLYYTHSAGQKITIDGRFLVGVLMGTLPYISVNVSDQYGDNATVNSYQASGFGFATDIGLDVRYSVLPQLSVILCFDDIGSSPEFNFIATGVAATSNGQISQIPGQLVSGKQSFQLNIFTLGIGYTLFAK